MLVVQSPAPTVAGAAAYGSTDKDSAALVDPSREGGSRRDDSDAKTLVEHAHDASMLNVGSSMAHLIVDLARSTVIICAAILIYLGYGAHSRGTRSFCRVRPIRVMN